MVVERSRQDLNEFGEEEEAALSVLDALVSQLTMNRLHQTRHLVLKQRKRTATKKKHFKYVLKELRELRKEFEERYPSLSSIALGSLAAACGLVCFNSVT